MAFLTDLFTDTNGVVLSAHTADSGGTWSKNSTLSGVLTINTNRAYCSTTNACYFNTVGAPISADYEVTATITVITNINSNIGVCGRMATSANTMYYAFLSRVSTGGGTYTIQLSSYVAGTPNSLGSYSITAPSGDHTIKLRMLADQISVDWDGVTRIGPVTDTAVTDAGKAGVRATTASSTTTGYHLADVTASDVPAGPLVAMAKKLAASLSGGMVPAGAIVSAAKKLAVSAAGEVVAAPASGGIISSAKPMAAVFGGVQQPAGSITAATMHPVVIAAGGQTQTGAAAMAIKKAAATLAGSQPFAGTAAAALAKALFAGAGEQQQGATGATGTIVSTPKQLQTSLAGMMQPAGTVTVALKPLNAYLVAAQTMTGGFTATLRIAGISAAGEQPTVATITATIVAARSELAGFQPPQGAITITITPAQTEFIGAGLAMFGAFAAQTRVLVFAARAFYLAHTPAKRTYTVPADDRILIITAESRVTVVPRLSSTLLVRRGAS